VCVRRPTRLPRFLPFQSGCRGRLRGIHGPRPSAKSGLPPHAGYLLAVLLRLWAANLGQGVRVRTVVWFVRRWFPRGWLPRQPVASRACHAFAPIGPHYPCHLLEYQRESCWADCRSPKTRLVSATGTLNQKQGGKQHRPQTNRDHQQHRLVLWPEQIGDALPHHITQLFREKPCAAKRSAPGQSPTARQMLLRCHP
jgi:hypothetical protein